MKVTNDGHRFYIELDNTHAGIYTSSWGVVVDEARDRGAKTIELYDERTGELLTTEEVR